MSEFDGTSGIDDDLFVDIDVRKPAVVRARMLVLDAVGKRLGLEAAYQAGVLTRDEAWDERFDLRAGLQDDKADGEMTTAERDVIESDPGELEADLAEEHSTSLESLSALAGLLLGVGGPPTPPLLVESKETIDAIEEAVEKVRASDGTLVLPNDDELEAIREYYELWHWRVLLEGDLRSANPAERARIEQEIEEVSKEIQTVGLNDLTTGMPLEQALFLIAGWRDEELASFERAVAARLRAINWLCGIGERWDSTEEIID